MMKEYAFKLFVALSLHFILHVIHNAMAMKIALNHAQIAFMKVIVS